MASFSEPKNNADNKDDAQETLSAIDANASTRQSESSSSDGSTSSSSDEDEIDELTQRRGTKLNAFLTEKPKVSSPIQSKEMILGVKYLVEIPESGSIGISWETNWEGKQTIVKSFHRTDGKHGDAKLSGKVDKQDILIAINGVDVTEEDHHDTLKQLRLLEGKKINLRFCKPASPASSNFVQLQEDPEIRKAKLEIHERKINFYRAKDNKEDMVQCYLQIYEGTWLTHFHLHLESDKSFVLGASCMEDMSSGFVFHTMADMTWDATMQDIPTDPNSHSYLGQMISNFSGTTFTIHDYRVIDPGAKNSDIHELGYIMYDVNILGRVPNSLKAIIPRFDEQYMDGPQNSTISQRIQEQNTEHSSLDYTLVDQLTFKKDHKYNRVETKEEAQLLFLQTKKPVWSEEHEAWCLDFGGRVKKASKNNFILEVDQDRVNLKEEFSDTPLMIFGKVNASRYSLDYRYPLSPMQAFAIALTTFASKLAVV